MGRYEIERLGKESLFEFFFQVKERRKIQWLELEREFGLSNFFFREDLCIFQHME